MIQLLKPSSVIDIGCGTGVWVKEFVQAGVSDVIGVDGAYVPLAERQIDADRFIEADLTQPLSLGDRRDLAICLEVAEHLPTHASQTLVDSLVDAAPAVFFSAATPGQGGTDHINEQWPDYWITKFEAHGWTCWDVIRRDIRYNSQVAWIYRQNMLLMLAPDHWLHGSVDANSRLKGSADDVHFEYVARYILERQPSAGDALRRVVMLARMRAKGWRQ